MDKVVSKKYWEIGYVESMNFSRDEKFDYLGNATKVNELVESLVNKGFLAEKPVHIYPVKSDLGDFEDKANGARAVRLEYWAKHETIKVKIHLTDEKDPREFQLSAVELANAHKALYLTEKGNDRKITHLAVSGFRRSYAVTLANAILIRLQRPIIDTISVIESQYGSMAEMQEACLWENLSQAQGVVGLTLVDKLSAARRMFQEGALEVALRRIFKDGMGQKLYGLCWCDSRYGTNLVDQCVADPKLFGPLSAAKLREFRKLYQDAESVEMSIDEPESDEEKAALAKAHEDMKPDNLMEYFKDPKKGQKKNDRMATKDVIEGITQNPVMIIQEVAKRILNDTTTGLKPYIPYAAEINSCVMAIMAGGKVTVDPDTKMITIV
jgi:hypothetical protein